MTKWWRRALSASLVALSSACTTTDTVSAEPMSLAALARAWSANSSDTSCRTTGPRGEYLGAGGSYCQWPTISRGAEFGIVGATREFGVDFELLTWERSFRDSTRAFRLADSLTTEFTRQGLSAYECPGKARRWQAPGLGVHLTLLPSRNDNLVHVLIQATIMPAALPAFLCPSAPTLPVVPPAAPRPNAT